MGYRISDIPGPVVIGAKQRIMLAWTEPVTLETAVITAARRVYRRAVARGVEDPVARRCAAIVLAVGEAMRGELYASINLPTD